MVVDSLNKIPYIWVYIWSNVFNPLLDEFFFVVFW